MDSEIDRVVPLDRLPDFEVADGDPDVRGWDVISEDGRRIGEVGELLIDTEAMRVRYLAVDLDEGVAGPGASQDLRLLVPIGYAHLNEADDQVIVEGLDSAQLREPSSAEPASPGHDRALPTPPRVHAPPFAQGSRSALPVQGAGADAGGSPDDTSRLRDPSSSARIGVRERAVPDGDPSRGGRRADPGMEK